jgi:phosphoglycerol transferase MdoB-like AlkP superfamily enzyme
MLAVQLESFFDARALYSGIREDVLASFDSLRSEGGSCGQLDVPAWGANTVRTEFAFLTGVIEKSIGVHRFNPYRAVARGHPVASLPGFLKNMGYRMIAIHPYHANFYSRDMVFRKFGFDEFLDIDSFNSAQRCGAYVADAELGDKIIQVLRRATTPTFVFAITMESHGPLHLERPQPSEFEKIYTASPPPGCEELSVYLRHLRHADAMLGSLRTALTALTASVEFCCFGDHVPIMPDVYRTLGTPTGEVPYLLWNNRKSVAVVPPESSLPVHALALAWLRGVVQNSNFYSH